MNLGITIPEWVNDTLPCVQTDPELFFPEKGSNPRPGKRLCAGCDLRETCLEWALANDEQWGTYGGMTARERRNLKPKQPVRTTCTLAECDEPVQIGKDAHGNAKPTMYCSRTHAKRHSNHMQWLRKQAA